jgi:hypothetical protein
MVFRGITEADWEAPKSRFCHPLEPNRERLNPCDISRSLI